MSESHDHRHSRLGVSDDAQGGLLVALAVIGYRLIFTGEYLRFVQGRMKWPLVVASTVFFVLGAATVAKAWRTKEATTTQRHLGPAVGWLLGAPIAVLLLVAPAPLGADFANRQAVRTTRLPQSQNITFDPLPAPTNGAVDLSLTDYSERALYDSTEGLAAVPVRLLGFVVRDDEAPGGYFLTRFRIACCAADAFAVQVSLKGKTGDYADDTWLEVVGTWTPTQTTADGTEFLRAVMQVSTITEINDRPDPYE